jgi:hypothetical protein
MAERRVAFLLRISQVLKERLAAVAKQEHRSLNQQIEFILESFLSDTGDKQVHEPQSHKGGHG